MKVQIRIASAVLVAGGGLLAAVPAASAAPSKGPIHAKPMKDDPGPGAATQTDHYSEASDGSTITTTESRAGGGIQPATVSGLPFNYTYNFSSILRGRDMVTGTGRFCNVIDTFNSNIPYNSPHNYLKLRLIRNSGGSVSPDPVIVTSPGTGWCWGGIPNGVTYHFNYEVESDVFGYGVSGSGHAYG